MSRWIPYVTLVIGVAFSQLEPQPWVQRAIVLGAAGLALVWVRLLYPARDEAQPQSGWRLRVYVAGLLALAFGLMLLHPMFFVFAITGFFHAALLRPWPVMVAGVLLTSLVVTALIVLNEAGAETITIYVLIVIIQTGAISAGMIEAEKRSELSEQRRRALAELEEALRENATLQKQIVTQAREAGVLDERQRLAREIHDTLAQGLAGVITQLEAVRQVREQPTELERRLHTASALARESLKEARRSVRALGPAALESSRLPDAVADVAGRWRERTAVAVEVTTTGTVRALIPEVEVTLLRVVQEGLANIAKHARATRVGVTLSFMDDVVTVDVRDDGIGFDPRVVDNGRNGGFGLTAMGQRVTALAGTLSIESEPGEGTAVSVRVPAVSLEASDG